MVYFKRVAIGIAILLALAVGSGILFAYLYGDEVKTALVEKLNEKLAVKVTVKDISFSVLSKFPMASLQFDQVVCPSTYNEKDTLFSADRIFLQFDIMDVFNGRYVIKKVDVDQAQIDIRVGLYGNDNYHFWKKTASDDSSKSVEFSIALEEISLNNTHFHFVNRTAKIEIDCFAKHLKFNGHFSNVAYSLEADAEIEVRYIMKDKTLLLEEKSVASEFELKVDSTTYQITRGFLEIDNIKFDVEGRIEQINTKTSQSSAYQLDLIVNTHNVDISAGLELIPQESKQFLAGYTVRGNADLESKITGTFGKDKFPLIALSYSVSRASIQQDSSGFSFDKVSLEGTYISTTSLKDFTGSSKQGSLIEVSSYNLSINGDRLEGVLTLADLSDPILQFTSLGELNLGHIHKANYSGLDTLYSLSGRASIEASFKGRVKYLTDLNRRNIRKMNLSGTIELEGVRIRMREETPDIHLERGTITLNDNDVFIESLVIKIESSDMVLDGYLKNLLSFVLLEDEKLFVGAEIASDKINLDELLKDYSSSSSTDTAYTLRFPERVNSNLKLKIAALKFRRFEGQNIRGVVMLKNKKLIAKELIFDAMDGSVSAMGVIDGTRSDNILITCDADIRGINVTKLFYQFENFGQSTITDKHLKGKADVTVQFASVWDLALKPDMDKIYAKANITITRGELVEFEPMMALSEYIEVAELKHVRFSTLQNDIEIKNRNIYIPRMEIKSTALNVIASGTHGFDNRIDYKIRVYLPELLAKKSRKKKRNNEFGEIEDDGLGIWLFLSMTGNADDPIIKYDRKEAIKKIGEDLKEEKRTLKKILNEEFGWFKKDTTLNKDKGKEGEREKFDDGYFIIEWDEDAPEQEEEEDDDDF